MSDTIEPISVRFPLVGEWCAVNTPGHKIPSHGTDQFGLRYAYDFLQIDWGEEKGLKFYKTSTFKSLLLGVKLKDTYCWSQPIYAPFDGEVIEAKDGMKERNPIHIVCNLSVLIKNTFFFRAESNEDLHPVLGNYIILKKCKDIYSLIAHARDGSIKVSAGEVVSEGQMLGEVGHSGNSTAPHLHFQLMDRPNLLEAKGLPCCFNNYKLYKQGEWVSIMNGIPGRRERIHA